MNSLNAIRHLKNNRIVKLPKELYELLKIEKGKDSFEIHIEKDMLILQKYIPKCVFCNSPNHISSYTGQIICSSCLNELKKKDCLK